MSIAPSVEPSEFGLSARQESRGTGHEKDADQWLAANRAALDSSNAYVDAKGLPLARFRQF
jgi:post-segregation antitoxin (ccd killing protein)